MRGNPPEVDLVGGTRVKPICLRQTEADKFSEGDRILNRHPDDIDKSFRYRCNPRPLLDARVKPEHDKWGSGLEGEGYDIVERIRDTDCFRGYASSQ